MAKKAKTILKRCIEDVETTHWCKNVLTTFNREGTKQMGCALGLLAINGEHVEKGRIDWPHYPSQPVLRGAQAVDSSEGLRKAVAAVYRALPEKYRYTFDEEADLESDLGTMETMIMDFNDAPGTGRARSRPCSARPWNPCERTSVVRRRVSTRQRRR